MVNGQVEGGYTEAFELICCDCGDDPYLDYSQISFRLRIAISAAGSRNVVLT